MLQTEVNSGANKQTISSYGVHFPKQLIFLCSFSDIRALPDAIGYCHSDHGCTNKMFAQISFSQQ